MLTLALLTGIWTTSCIQTQIGHRNQGYVIETYNIKESSEYEFQRAWFRDPNCREPEGVDSESGSITLGKEIRTIFQPGNVYEANFHSQGGIDLGAISLKENRSLKVARGVKNSSLRNSMLGLFEYRKQ